MYYPFDTNFEEKKTKKTCHFQTNLLPAKVVFVDVHSDHWLSWGSTTRQPLWVILCRLSEKGRREIEDILEEMKERDRGERKMNESEETEGIKHSPSNLTCCKDSRPCPTASQYQLDA